MEQQQQCRDPGCCLHPCHQFLVTTGVVYTAVTNFWIMPCHRPKLLLETNLASLQVFPSNLYAGSLFDLISLGFYSGIVLTQIFFSILTTLIWGMHTPFNKQLWSKLPSFIITSNKVSLPAHSGFYKKTKWLLNVAYITAASAGLSRSQNTGCNNWLITNLGTASRQEHKCSSFRQSS